SAIEQDFLQNEISGSAYKYQKDIESGDKIIVGVNKYEDEEESPENIFEVDDSIRVKQTEKLKDLRAKRDGEKVQALLSQIESSAGGTENLMPLIIESVENMVTLGEISDALRKVFGEYKG
ncbi:MAG: methylmalonyl-CoA mutase, partial [Bacteroidetes bacterium]|nr:methylmalonyl-CoA mutase [Bacteroidota bacterium]